VAVAEVGEGEVARQSVRDRDGTRRSRIRPMVRPRASAATATRAFLPMWRRPPPARRRPPTSHPPPPCPTGGPARDHRPAQLVEPGGPVAPEAQNPLEAERARPGLLAGHPPHRPEPHRQRRARVLEDRPGGHGDLARAPGAHPEPPSGRPARRALAGGAGPAVRPSDEGEVLAARLLGGEAPLQLRKGPRVVLQAPQPLPVAPTVSQGHAHMRPTCPS
jgi:hypothetical protein